MFFTFVPYGIWKIVVFTCDGNKCSRNNMIYQYMSWVRYVIWHRGKDVLLRQVYIFRYENIAYKLMFSRNNLNKGKFCKYLIEKYTVLF